MQLKRYEPPKKHRGRKKEQISIDRSEINLKFVFAEYRRKSGKESSLLHFLLLLFGFQVV